METHIITYEKWPNGDIYCHTPETPFRDANELLAYLAEAQDDGRTIRCVRMSFADDGSIIADDITQETAESLRWMAEAYENAHGEKPWLHPLLGRTDYDPLSEAFIPETDAKDR